MSGSGSNRNHRREARTRAEAPEGFHSRASPQRVRRALALLTRTYHGCRQTGSKPRTRFVRWPDGNLPFYITSGYRNLINCPVARRALRTRQRQEFHVTIKSSRALRRACVSDHISRKELKHDRIKETIEHGAEAVISHGQFTL